MTTYIKTMKVIHSCQTMQQIEIAKNYIELARKSLNHIEFWIVWESLIKQTVKITEL